ncbi:dihydroorotate dehydrogenase (quinone) [Paenibacillus montaniterrae]|uniref:Dihydroorotate dehydrogenase (quinone) n=1 Tax=Paenibacillus montaniterrae TaxID=429341 RepID=A0A920CWL7_9BACL|nr:quinone-dependent dihydroorotate dehydrogenase [Paenibacillus montaniterrae]GIP15380.1 dihydroorotate dehydrogenase (quinone) [Paenibacillus montaniterrae]
MLYRSILKPFFFKLDPEKAHHIVVDGFAVAGKVPGVLAIMNGLYGVKPAPELAVQLLGMQFQHPVGLAAGLDKNGVATDTFSSIGLSFVEAGTVTPKPQPGNEQPRLFRLPPDEALINRMGFNNKGADEMRQTLQRRKRHDVPVAVNIGKNKVTANELAHEDYRACIRTLYDEGDFFVVNISSPNTQGLRDLQHGNELHNLLVHVSEEMEIQASSRNAKVKPIFVKIAPDMTDDQLKHTVHTIMDSSINGIIATNTTLSRDGLTHANRQEAGGLSGVPLRERSTEVIRQVYSLTEGKLPIIGSGGIFTAQDAYDKIRAGATLVEIYTALIYKGPEVLRELTDGLKECLRKDGFSNITEAIGADHK